MVAALVPSTLQNDLPLDGSAVGILYSCYEREGSRVGVRNLKMHLWKERFISQRRRIATVAAALLVVGVAMGVVFGHNGLTAYGKKRVETRDLDRELKTLARENDSLAGHIDRLQNDPNAIEHQAREELHYTRPGEVIITLPPDRPASHVTDSAEHP